ncbi:MAG: hypothetical protein ACI9H8_001586 [Lysobacterales bacterium]|jgi:hypothetical protein
MIQVYRLLPIRGWKTRAKPLDKIIVPIDLRYDLA